MMRSTQEDTLIWMHLMQGKGRDKAKTDAAHRMFMYGFRETMSKDWDAYTMYRDIERTKQQAALTVRRLRKLL